MQLILISGMAGAGKSTALRILEDNAYYCVDNLPPIMLKQLIGVYSMHSEITKIAVGVGTTSLLFLQQLPDVIEELYQLGINIKIIYLDASTDILIKRFSETRRKHPLSNFNKTITDCIYEERNILLHVSKLAHRIDTSKLNPNELGHIIKQFVNLNHAKLIVVVQSFGFKYGVPIDSDFIFDVRCLPNPYYDSKIKQYNGNDDLIINFLDKQEKSQQLLTDIYVFLNKWIIDYKHDHRNYITISIGCTGGVHRSVYIVNKLSKLLLLNNSNELEILVRHRQINPNKNT